MKQKKKVKIPLVLRLIRSVFPILEKVFPGLAALWARKLFFQPIRFPVTSREREFAGKTEQFQIEVNGNKVNCYSYGFGKPVIFVHGWSGRATQFWKFAEVFANYGYRIISFDAPGHGQSSGHTTTVVEFAEIVGFLADNYKAKLLVGHSLGGVASLLAINRGTPADHLLMISSPSIADEIISEFLTRINASPKSGNQIRKYVKDLTNQPFENFMSLHLIKEVKNVRIKLIHDETDSQVPIDHSEKLAEEYPGAELVRTSGLGHNRILADDKVVRESLLFASMS